MRLHPSRESEGAAPAKEGRKFQYGLVNCPWLRNNLWRFAGDYCHSNCNIISLAGYRDVSSQPHIVATIEPNRWSMIHADLIISNTGNATAYNIKISFSPNPALDKGDKMPLQNISILKPGQSISSYLTPYENLFEKSYDVSLSWSRNTQNNDLEKNSYTINMADIEGITKLGASDPLIQIAEQMKKFQEVWRPVAQGSRKVRVDTFTSSDRLHERRQIERLRRLRQRQTEASSAEAPKPDQPEAEAHRSDYDA